MVSDSDGYSIQSEWIGFLDKKKCLVSIWIKSEKKNPRLWSGYDFVVFELIQSKTHTYYIYILM